MNIGTAAPRVNSPTVTQPKVDQFFAQRIGARFEINGIALFCGILLSLAACSFAGEKLAQKTYFHNFHRFHKLISPDAGFYPTLRQMLNTVKATVPTDKILVIVGGNSILNGVGQSDRDLWSLKLQKDLGPNFVVVNFSFRGAYPFDGGYVAFEALQKDYKRSILITDSAPWQCLGIGINKTYSYLFWDAYERNLLIDNSRRLEKLGTEAISPESEAKGWLDRYLNFTDLWTAISYEKATTFWSSLTLGKSTRARRTFSDNEVSSSEHFENLLLDLDICRQCSRDAFVWSNVDGWVPKQAFWQSLSKSIDTAVPNILRARMLVLLPKNCPYHLHMLTPSEQKRDALVFELARNLWRKSGYHSLTIGSDYQSADYRDRCHLSPSGGNKLAETVAAQVHYIAKEQGFE